MSEIVVLPPMEAAARHVLRQLGPDHADRLAALGWEPELIREDWPMWSSGESALLQIADLVRDLEVQLSRLDSENRASVSAALVGGLGDAL